MNNPERLESLVRHINLVRENCSILSHKLIENGEFDMGRRLLQLGLAHDNSKFSGIEWMFLTNPDVTNRAGLKYAIEHHTSTNPHHPEYWAGGVAQMPKIYRYEMIADIVARSSEMGTSARDYLNNTMPKKYGFTCGDNVHTELLGMLDMLCNKPFEPVVESAENAQTIHNNQL